MKICRRSYCLMIIALISSFACGQTFAADQNIQSLLNTIRKVGPKGSGNLEASNALNALRKCDASQLPQIIAGLDGANPIAENYIRSVVEVIANRQLKSGGKLPQQELEKVVLNQKHSPRGRRLAFDWLQKIDSTASDRIIPKMLNDPSLELRRDAVARLIAAAEKYLGEKNEPEAIALFEQALAASRDLDQIKTCAKQLTKLKQEVDLQNHFGFISSWNIIGSFDNRDGKGFGVAYPPETEIDLQAAYKGLKAKVTWSPLKMPNDYGVIDLNKALGKVKGAIVYAQTDFFSPKSQEAEIRVGCINAVKVWVNGQLVISREVYHANMEVDQYIAKVKLKPGKNQILLKICQNEQTESWAQRWQYQIRICDKIGTAIHSKKK